MKKIILGIATLITTSVMYAQQEAGNAEKADKENRKEWRKRKREERKKEYELLKSEGAFMLESRDFVLKASQISGKNGSPIMVTDEINFIKINGEEIIVQYGLNHAMGFNGVGGFTYEGRIRKMVTNDYGKGKPFPL